MPSEVYNVKTNMSEASEEAYKVLRTNIQFCELKKSIKLISITSYSPGEGKSTVAMNLAISMAKSGMKVLLVDADMRKPIVLKELGRNDFKGLSNYILGRAGLEDVITDTDINGFYFVTCGIKPVNPSELLESNRFAEFLGEVKEYFDMVIIDTPPLGSVIDAAVIASKTDGTILVIKQGAVRQDNIKRLKEQLEKVNARILGVVLNKVDKTYYRNYYGAYDYYGNRKKYVKGWIKQKKSERS